MNWFDPNTEEGREFKARQDRAAAAYVVFIAFLLAVSLWWGGV